MSEAKEQSVLYVGSSERAGGRENLWLIHLRRILGERGLSVEDALPTRELVERLSALQYRGVIIDGSEISELKPLVSSLRAAVPQTPIIVAGVNWRLNDIRKAFIVGASDILDKNLGKYDPELIQRLQESGILPLKSPNGAF